MSTHDVMSRISYAFQCAGNLRFDAPVSKATAPQASKKMINK